MSKKRAAELSDRQLELQDEPPSTAKSKYEASKNKLRLTKITVNKSRVRNKNINNLLSDPWRRDKKALSYSAPFLSQSF
jgi:hypothetical protein